MWVVRGHRVDELRDDGGWVKRLSHPHHAIAPADGSLGYPPGVPGGLDDLMRDTAFVRPVRRGLVAAIVLVVLALAGLSTLKLR